MLVSILPISPTDKARIETLVQKCLDAKGQNVTQWETEIDDIVPVSMVPPMQNAPS
jgi:hypothetical protein